MALNTVGIVCALASEARHLGPAIRSGEGVGRLANGTLVAVTGMGSPAAERGAQAVIAAGATALASWGMAGGLDPGLKAGAVLLPAEVMDPDGRLIGTDCEWREGLRAAIAAQAPVSGGRLLSSSRAVGSVAGKAELFAKTRAAAVDMESAAIGAVAEQHRMRFIAVRVIVDSASDSLPRAVTNAADRQGHLHIGRLIGSLAKAPNELAPLIRLARRYGAANRSLAAIARAGSLAPPAFHAAADSHLS